MPSITPADALILASDKLTDAISGLLPKSTVTQDAVDQLMMIFKQQARDSIDAATAQRVLMERAQAQRVGTEPQPQTQTAPTPTFQVEADDGDDAPSPQAIPQITQAEYNSPPASS